jgi:hypothetical protein
MIPTASRADTLVRDTQLHLSLGYFNASFSTNSQNTNGSISDPALSFEYERFSTNKDSYYLRTTFAYGSTQLRYEYVGLGKRHYFLSDGTGYDATDAGSRVSKAPQWRYYLGGDFGLSSGLIKVQDGGVLSINAGQISLNPSIGAIYQANKVLGIELQAGIGIGFGITDVDASSFGEHVSLGVSWFF